MNVDVETETRFRALHTDDTLLKLNPEEEAFFKLETGIQDTEELRKHIIKVQEDAYKVSRCSRADQIESALGAITSVFRVQIYPYFCIRGFRFTKLKIAGMPVYPRVLELGKNRPDAIFLDIGCCCKDQLILVVCLDSLTDNFVPGQSMPR